jgi:hypothetical protein
MNIINESKYIEKNDVENNKEVEEEFPSQLVNGKRNIVKRNVSQVQVPIRIQTLFHNVHGTPYIPKKLELIHTNPNIFFIPNFLKENDIKHLDNILTQHSTKFRNSFTENDNNEEIISQERTSTFIHLTKGQDSILRGIELRASTLVSMSSEFVEPLQLVSYTRGQKFDTHHDGGTLGDDGTVEMVDPKRYVTVFSYLNTLPEGQGHTEFPALDNVSIRPIKGAAVMFCNVMPNGEADVRTVHRACPVHGNLRKIGMNIWLGDQNMQGLCQVKSKTKIDSSKKIDMSHSILTLSEKKYNDYINKNNIINNNNNNNNDYNKEIENKIISKENNFELNSNGGDLKNVISYLLNTIDSSDDISNSSNGNKKITSPTSCNTNVNKNIVDISRIVNNIKKFKNILINNCNADFFWDKQYIDNEMIINNNNNLNNNFNDNNNEIK